MSDTHKRPSFTVTFCVLHELSTNNTDPSQTPSETVWVMERSVLIPQLLRRDGKTQLVEPLKSNGFEISPTIAVISCFQLFTFFSYAVAPSKHVMASTSNFCYLAAGLHRAVVSLVEGHSSTFLLGQLAGSSFIYVFLGASSFAFHAESVLNSPAHSFDILGGWFLVLHVCFVCFSVCTIALVKWCTKFRPLASSAVTVTQVSLSILIVIAFTILVTFYDAFYSRQLEFFFALGPGAAVFGTTCRFMLVYKKGDVQWRAIRIASFELVVALTAVFAAILCQGELLSLTNRKLSSTDGFAYDLFHAQWHFLLATATAALYSRAADAAKVVMGTHRVCVCNQSWLDFGGLSLLFCYSVAAAVLKESRAGVNASLLVLFAFNALMAVHAMITLFDWIKRRRQNGGLN